MKEVDIDTIIYYDKQVVKMLSDKYGYSYMDAFIKFINSKTYKMLCDVNCQMWDFGPYGLFDVFESELVTGDPRNSVYIRCD